LIAYAGRPDVQVEHHTIVTFDTDEHQIDDLGFRLPTGGLSQWRAGMDGKAVELDAPSKEGEAAFVHQFRWNKARLVGDRKGAHEGEKADGYLTGLPAMKSKPAVTVSLRDIWQKFPKELSVGPDYVAVHFWPDHGIDTFTPAEMYTRENIYKLWWFHQGNLLNLKFPQAAYDQLKEWDTASTWGYQMGDVEGMSESALGAYGEGVSIGNDFSVRLHARDEDAAVALREAKLFQMDPWARPTGRWNASTLVEDEIAPADASLYPKVEREIDTVFSDLYKVQVDGGTEYGMWTVANTHNHWDPVNRRAFLHRVWQAGHYRQMYTPWLLLFRGNSFDNLTWARASIDHYKNIDTINWSNPEKGLRWHEAGAMYHAKGFSPWGATRAGQAMTADVGRAGVANHFVNPDALLMKWLMTGDNRAHDLYMMWSDVVRKRHRGGLSTREYVNTFGEVLNLYRNLHDPDALVWIHASWKSLTGPDKKMMTMPFASQHGVWHKQYLFRLYNQVRDPAIVDAVKEYTDTYTGYQEANAFMYQRTGDVSYLQRNMEEIQDGALNEYHNPGDPLSGFDEAFHATGLARYQTLPYWIAAARKAGIREIVPPGVATMVYPYSPVSFQAGPGTPSSVEVIAIDEDDKPFAIHMEGLIGTDQHAMNVFAMSPDGKLIVERPYSQETHKVRYIGENALHYDIPSDGQNGAYRVQVRSHMVIFKAPYTTLAMEGVRLQADRKYIIRRKVDAYVSTTDDRPFTLTLEGTTQYMGADAAYARIEDAAGNIVLETSVLAGSQRASDSVTIEPAKHPGPWRLVTVSGLGPMVSWSGEAKGLVMAPTAAGAARIAAFVRELKD